MPKTGARPDELVIEGTRRSGKRVVNRALSPVRIGRELEGDRQPTETWVLVFEK